MWLCQSPVNSSGLLSCVAFEGPGSKWRGMPVPGLSVVSLAVSPAMSLGYGSFVLIKGTWELASKWTSCF